MTEEEKKEREKEEEKKEREKEEEKKEREKKERERKEKVLHTRISESLDEELRGQASRLGVSVSNLVRNVLQNTFGLVEDIVTDSSNIASAARRSAGSPPPPAASPGGEGFTVGRVPPAAAPAAPAPAAGPAAPAPAAGPVEPLILAWQEARLNLNGVCDRCNAILAKGTRAAVAIFEGGAGPRTFRCLNCLEEELDHGTDPAGEPEPDQG
jgi:hypothetical protein